tara:strand:- start:132 stop:365 length:234 start_codon:yes stop_codon:yes gene_type:complete
VGCVLFDGLVVVLVGILVLTGCITVRVLLTGLVLMLELLVFFITLRGFGAITLRGIVLTTLFLIVDCIIEACALLFC